MPVAPVLVARWPSHFPQPVDGIAVDGAEQAAARRATAVAGVGEQVRARLARPLERPRSSTGVSGAARPGTSVTVPKSTTSPACEDPMPPTQPVTGQRSPPGARRRAAASGETDHERARRRPAHADGQAAGGAAGGRHGSSRADDGPQRERPPTAGTVPSSRVRSPTTGGWSGSRRHGWSGSRKRISFRLRLRVSAGFDRLPPTVTHLLWPEQTTATPHPQLPSNSRNWAWKSIETEYADAQFPRWGAGGF